MKRFSVLLCLASVLLATHALALPVTVHPTVNPGLAGASILAWWGLYEYGTDEADLLAAIDPDGDGWLATGWEAGLVAFAGARGVTATAGGSGWESNTLWDLYVSELDAGRPMELHLDRDGDAWTDWWGAGVGYEVRADGSRWFAVSSGPGYGWHEWTYAFPGTAWGVAMGYWLRPQDPAPVPEPGTLVLLLTGATLAGCRRIVRRLPGRTSRH